MLGTLARWLRLLGYDARYFRDLDDADLLARARRGGRVLVTRDRALASRRAAGPVVLLRARTLGGQWAELARACGLRPRPSRALTRCALCNARLVSLLRRQARRLVPPYVHATRRRFRCCPKCGRVFWRATHLRGIAARLRALRRAAAGLGRRSAAAGLGRRPGAAIRPGSGPGKRARRSP